jgi:murein DD-endopeptidase MepM/ murein hydrolase activator NlpD
MQLIKPFKGNYPVTQKFGDTYTDPKGHKGIDYALPVGTPVLAAADGTVERAGADSTGYGNVIIIRHLWNDGTVYAHLRNWAVQPGQQVKAGEIIGYSGNTGNSTGAHLHFEYRTVCNDYKSAIDPEIFMKTSSQNQNPEPVGAVSFGRVRVIADYVAIRNSPGITGTVLTRAKKDDVLLSTDTIKPADGLNWRLCYYPVYVVENDGTTDLIEKIE